MTQREDNDDDYAPIVATTWGNQNANNNEQSDDVSAWRTLADPDAKVGPGGLGSGNLHRRGRNFIPVNEEIIIEQRTKGQVSKEKMNQALKTASKTMGVHITSKHTVKYKKVPKPAFSQKHTYTRTHPVKHEPPKNQLTTLRPPPANNAWGQALSEVPFWEGTQKSEQNANILQKYKQTTTTSSRPEVPPEWDEPKHSWADDMPVQSNDRPSWIDGKDSWNHDTPSWDSDKPSWDNDKPTWSDNRPSWIKEKLAYREKKPTYREKKPSWNKDEQMRKPAPWKSASEDSAHSSGSWANQHDIRTVDSKTAQKKSRYSADIGKNDSAPPRPSIMDRPRATRPPPGLFQNAVAQIAGKVDNNRILSKPPGLSPIPLNIRAQQQGHSPLVPVPVEPSNNPVVITINIELESGGKVPVKVCLHDDPEALAREFSMTHNIDAPGITESLSSLFRAQKDLAIQKRENQNLSGK
ncbi:hypothetical protein DFQ28_008322 [Apophysomyces sp. BC1034]|nr:hypothetical protein DFQ30_010712 [Apophysomyces sp. BC1015]KAG0181330.1 hypothetical protein DFQ29_008690 [Apophysomyces sp. BC1021]KAG0186109.1 hypothetical protein DFQ28_008322 [Apophysomyces sp. BC1034]